MRIIPFVTISGVFGAFLCSLSLLAMVGGCSRSTPTKAAVATNAKSHKIGKQKMPGTLTSVSSMPPSAMDHDSTKTAKTPKRANDLPTSAATFTPPYPHRRNPFSPPATRVSGRTQATTGNVNTVQLKGFVGIDEVKAVLVIHGQPYVLGKGEQRFGVQVIQISQPQVTLQRRRTRWTESLRDSD